MGTTSWQIGSHPTLADVTVTVQVSGESAIECDVITSSQGVYLYDNGSQFDALFLLEDAIRTFQDEFLSETNVFLTRDRKVRIEWMGTEDPQSVQITGWSGADGSAFQEMLGFDGSEISAGFATTLTAPNTSPYLWSCNKIETPLEARRGKTGAPYHDTAVGMSGTRVVVATTNNSGSTNTFHWERIANARFWTQAEDSGEYFVWWDVVQRRFRRFKVWQSVNELDGSTTEATIGAALGPYIFRWDGATPLSFPHTRDIDFIEDLHTVDLPCVEVDEYT